jgi:hypothetical protein
MHLALNTPEIIGIAAVIIIVIAVIAFIALQRKRTRTEVLRRKFGPEYDWAMKKHGAKGEAVLLEREKRAEQIKLRDLDPGERGRFLEQWKTVQANFVDSPKGALTQAEDVIGALLDARGYPVGDFEQRTGDVSLTHPRVTENYRVAHACNLRLSKGETVRTEDMRAAMIHYRSLFDELVQAHTGELRHAAE